MTGNITKFKRSAQSDYTFSLLIPTWNNIAYLKLCLESIAKNSRFANQVIVIVNEGTDGTLDWIKEQQIDYVYSPENIGICYGLNAARSLVSAQVMIYINDDMYMLPDWDLHIKNEIDRSGNPFFMLSATMIEPFPSSNPCVIAANFGETAETFRESELLASFESLAIPDWSGSTWPPVAVHTDIWDLVGGLSPEFSPGMYSDPDLAMKLWNAGVRRFKGIGNSLCYHFGSKSTGRIARNDGRKTFIGKWGISAGTFTRYYLRSGAPFTGDLTAPEFPGIQKLFFKIKKAFS